MLNRNDLTFFRSICCLLLLPHIERLFEKLINNWHAYRDLYFAIYFLLFSNQLIASKIACKNLAQLINFIFIKFFTFRILGYFIYVNLWLRFSIFCDLFTRYLFFTVFFFSNFISFTKKARLLDECIYLQIQNLKNLPFYLDQLDPFSRCFRIIVLLQNTFNFKNFSNDLFHFVEFDHLASSVLILILFRFAILDISKYHIFNLN